MFASGCIYLRYIIYLCTYNPEYLRLKLNLSDTHTHTPTHTHTHAPAPAHRNIQGFRGALGGCVFFIRGESYNHYFNSSGR